MKEHARSALVLAPALMLSACATATQVLPTTSPTQTQVSAKPPISPGDKIGDMTIDNVESKHYFWLFDACDFNWALTEPFSQTVRCTVPELSEVGIGPLWGAQSTKFDASLQPMAWELSVDDYPVALNEFGYFDLSYLDSSAGFEVTYRNWNVLLRNLTAGRHVFRLSFSLSSPVEDGWNTYPPGKYEYVADLTVTEKPTYPNLPPVPEPGQHSYSSKDGDLDFLLYVPESYGQDPGKKWPLIVYLHDGEWRGSLDFIVRESLPQRLQTLRDFDFLVLSPAGHGGMEFWSKEELLVPVLHAIDEIGTTYSVDTDRTYLTGAGMGGNGVWAMGMRNPEYFAAIAPLGGYVYPAGIPENLCNLTEVPVWAFHGEEDFMVPPQVETELVDALVACGGTAQITVKPGAVIPIDEYYRSELFDWLLAHSRG